MKERKRVQLFFPEPSLTQQSFKDECDVNEIVRRFNVDTGVDYLRAYRASLEGHFGDFSKVGDYRTALERVTQANSVFMTLPPQLRSKFDNDTAKFLDFIDDPKNEAEMITLGLKEKPVLEPVSSSEKPDKTAQK